MGLRFVDNEHDRDRQTELDDCYQLIKTLTKFENETRHRLYVFIKKTSVNSAKYETIAHADDAFCPFTQA